MARDALRYLAALSRGGLAPFLRQALGDVTLADVLSRWARKRPDGLALESSGQQLSYLELDTAARSAAQHLHRLGARSGDVVALVGRNSIAYVAVLLGGARIGVTLALVHPELAGDPLRQALASAGATQVLCEHELAQAIESAIALPVTGYAPDDRGAFGPATGSPGTGFAGDRRRRDFALVYTSGTSGLPKACRLPHSRVLTAACLFGAPLFDFRGQDKLLCALPLYHGSPLMLGLGTCLVTGVPLVLERRFSSSKFLAAAARSGATALLYVGDLARLLLALPAGSQDRQHRLRLAVGNGMSSEVWQPFQARFGISSVREFYAATESPAGIFNLSGRVGSVGNLPYRWLLGFRLVRVEPRSGELLRGRAGQLVECADDEVGELLVRARRAGLGVYHGYAEANATEARLVHSAFRPGDVYFRTGDLLRRDRAGFYYFVERAGDTYRFRGENVSALQVERELASIPGVGAALVTSLAVPGYDGRVGLAALVLEPDFELASLELLLQRLPRSAVPRFVRAVAELPYTGSLKPKRADLSRDGVDPSRVPDPLWALIDERYRLLDAATYLAIQTGQIRL